MIHEKPYIFLVNNFLNEDECDKMLAKVSLLGATTRTRASHNFTHLNPNSPNLDQPRPTPTNPDQPSLQGGC